MGIRTRLVLLLGVVSVVGLAYCVVSRRPLVDRAGAPPPVIPCLVTIEDPAGGLASVRLEIPPDLVRGRRELTLAFADAREGPTSLRSFEAVADGRPLSATQGADRGAWLIRVPLARDVGSIVVSWTIDPTFFPPGGPSTPADARSRITADLAIIRSTSLLPIVDVPGAVYGIRFVLPPGWVAVTPWPTDGERVLAPFDPSVLPEYLALGPLVTEDIAIGQAMVRVVRPSVMEGMPFSVADILRRELELVAAPFRREGLHVATVVPASFMRGGAAGPRTIVQAPSPVLLAHEVFHWWNDGVLTAADAGWFREGLTEYYGIKVAREAGAWSSDDERACLADLAEETRRWEQQGPRSLVDASLDPSASRLVYAKGALVWLMVERRLQANGRYLEEAVRAVVTSSRTGLTTADLQALFSSIYGGLVDEALTRHVVGTEPLPPLDLGPATGQSGCARLDGR